MNDIDRELLERVVDSLTRVVRVEGTLTEHTRKEELFQTHVSETLDEINKTVISMATEHATVKGWIKGIVATIVVIGLLVSEAGRTVLTFLHGLVK